MPLFILTAGWILCGPEKWPRLRNLLFCGLVTTLLAGPVFWINRAALYNYYWVGQISGAEAATRITGFTAAQSLEFIYSYLRHQQLGPWFIRNALGLTLALLGLALLTFRTFRSKPGQQIDWDWLFFALAFFFVPALVLHFHRQKSNVVLGILVPGIVLLIGWIWSVLWPRAVAFTRSHPIWRFVPAALGLAALYLGGTFFVGRQRWQPHQAAFLEDARRVNQLSDYFFEHSRAGNLSMPRLGVDQVNEAFYAQVMQVVCYERKQVRMAYQGLLPTGILEQQDDIIMNRLRQCDFVLVTVQVSGQGRWPYDRQMRRLYPVVKAWCEANLRHVETFPIFGQQMSLYQRRDLP